MCLLLHGRKDLVEGEMEKLLEKHMYTTHAVAAAASVTLGTAVTYPLDTIKTLIQVWLHDWLNLVTPLGLYLLKIINATLKRKKNAGTGGYFGK